VYFFDCDKCGRCTHCCGEKNSNGGSERPFVILSDSEWNSKNDTELFALPLTKRGTGNTFSITVGEDTFEEASARFAFSGSIICCDKLCKIKNGYVRGSSKRATLTAKAYVKIRQNVLEFIRATV
jgi:hypothetical protein